MKKWLNPVRRFGQTLAWSLVLVLAATSWASAGNTSGTSSGTTSSATAAAPASALQGTTTDPDRGAGDDHDLLDADGDSDEAVQGLAVASSVLPQAMAGQFYSDQLAATGMLAGAAATWSGTPPYGLTLSPSGLISGTPAAGSPLGTATFTVSVTSTVQQVDEDDSGAEAVSESPSEENHESPPGVGTATATATLSLTLVPGIDITTPQTLPNAQVGAPYAYLISASGGSSGAGGTGFTWTLQSVTFVSSTASGGSVTTTTLPAGLTFSSDGVLSGTPTVAGVATIVVQTTNPPVPGYPPTAYPQSQTFTLDVLPTTLRVITDVMPDATVGGQYTEPLQTNGAGTPYPSGSATAPCGYTWTVATGALPTGLDLLCQNGQEEITGTPGTASVATFTLEATDDGSPTPGLVPAQQSASVELDIVVEPQSSLTIGYVTLPAGTVGQPLGPVALTVSGGTGPYTWSFAGSTPPPAWLQLVSGTSGEVLEGTPTAPFSGDITVQVEDANGNKATASFPLNIGAAGLSITTSTLLNGAVGSPYSAQFNATGGSGSYTWAVSPASAVACPTATGSQSTLLPCGLSLSPSGLLSTNGGNLPGGSGGAYDISVVVTDTSSPPLQASITLPLTITTPALTIDTSGYTLNSSNVPELPEAEETVPYSAVLQATGGNGPSTYNWLLGSHNALPSGLQLQPYSCSSCGEGVISGTPVVGDATGGPSNNPSDGIYSFQVQVTDNANNEATQTFSLQVLPVVTISTTSVPNGEVGASYKATLVAADGKAPYAWSVSAGSLPQGLILSASGDTATIQGTPSAAFTAGTTFTIRVKDALGGVATEQYTMTVYSAISGIALSPTSGTPGSGYTGTLSASGGTGSYTWSVSGQPSWLSLSGDQLTGTMPSSATSKTTYTFNVTASDGYGSATQSVTITG